MAKRPDATYCPFMRAPWIAIVLLAGVLGGCDVGDGDEAAPAASAVPADATTSTESRPSLPPLTPAAARQAVLIHVRGRERRQPESVSCEEPDRLGRVRCQLDYEDWCDMLDVSPRADGSLVVRQPELAVCVQYAFEPTG
jgi:hypothetical protein